MLTNQAIESLHQELSEAKAAVHRLRKCLASIQSGWNPGAGD